MRTGDLKGDLVNSAYSQGRISGLTSQPTPEEKKVALHRLEDMAEEFKGREICTGYNFEDEPNLNSPHGLQRKHWLGYQTNLSVKLLHDFGKTPLPGLKSTASGSYSFLVSNTAVVNPVQYPSRQPIGSGNTLRRHRYKKYYHPIPEAPVSCGTNKMFIDDIDNFVEHFDAYLIEPEEVAIYTIEADDGLTIVSSSLSTPDVSYQIKAVGDNESGLDSFQQVKIVATTSTGRITTRFINFELSGADL